MRPQARDRSTLALVATIVGLIALAYPPSPATALTRADRETVSRALSGLPQAELQLVLRALGRLPERRSHRDAAAIDRLGSTQRADLVRGLANALAPLSLTARRALLDALTGPATRAERRAVAAATTRALSGTLAGLQALASRVASGDAQLAAFLDRVLTMMNAHLRALITRALGGLPAATRPLIVALDEAGIADGDPRIVLTDVLMLQDPATAQAVQQAGFQAGSDCALAGCSPFDLVVNYVAAIPVAPPLIQQDIVNCILTPICTQPQRTGLIGYLNELYQEGQTSYEQLKQLTSAIDAEKVTAQESWIGTFAN